MYDLVDSRSSLLSALSIASGLLNLLTTLAGAVTPATPGRKLLLFIARPLPLLREPPNRATFIGMTGLAAARPVAAPRRLSRLAPDKPDSKSGGLAGRPLKIEIHPPRNQIKGYSQPEISSGRSEAIFLSAETLARKFSCRTAAKTKNSGIFIPLSTHLVGVTGFEPATTRPPDVYSNRTELRPDYPEPCGSGLQI